MKNTNRYKKKKSLLLLLVLIQVSLMVPTITYAQTMDGVIDESDWVLWFEDLADPSFSTKFSENDTSVFIGIITNNTEIGSNQLQVAFKAAENDFVILSSDISGTKFKPNTVNPETAQNYWAATRPGLPTGVEIMQGFTNGKVSYEICISKELLGSFGEDFPDNFTLWIMYTPEGNGAWIWSIIDTEGEVNFYPDSRSGWWFSLIESDLNDETPVFHAPEIPYGTILSLVTMLAAFYAISRKTSSFSTNLSK